MKKLVLTGAAGRLGSYLREPLSAMCDTLVSTDIVEGIGKLYDGETYVQADLGDLAALEAILEGADMVVHFGAIFVELQRLDAVNARYQLLVRAGRQRLHPFFAF